MDNSIELVPTQGNFTVNMAGTSLPVEADHAIEVRKVSLSYGPAKKPISVLNELSMEVCRGSIFGLLGPSGCGKTSLIRCILGVLKVDSGSVSVFGQAPGSPGSSVPGAGVGYMPQEITLYGDLTISETLCYFASLFGMSKSQIKERVNFLIQFLDLPDPKRLVNNLSGGQKRRVSLAASFIHKPPLLILDEPTVGVDPLLSQSIWQHLIELVQEDQLTVLITTHYIEEARDANRIGMMRDGKMLAQDSPAQLMERYKKPSLEAVFLHLCTKAEDVRNSATPTEVVVEQEDLSRRDSTSSAGSSGVDSMPESMEVPAAPAATPARPAPKAVSWSAHVSSMFLKNVINTSRNRLMMLFQFILPTIEVILFCACIGLNLHSIPVAVYDGDNSTFSRRILETLNPDLISQRVFDSESDALAAVRNGLASSALTMYGNFSTCLFERMMGLATDIDAEALHNSTIHLYPDMTNQLMVLNVEEEVIRVFLRVGQQFLEEIGANPALLEMPVKMEEPVYGPPKPLFRDYMAPGIILSIAFISAIPLTTLVLVLERRQGLLERTLVAGVSYLRIMISLLLPQVIIMFVSSLALMVFVFPVFGIPYHGEFVPILLLTFLQSICGMCFGVLISTVAKDENTATMLALGFFYPSLLLSGTVWPIEAMDNLMRHFALFLPQTYPIASMRNIISRGWHYTNWDVLSGFLVTIGWIVFFIVLSAVSFRFRKN